jgi:hypothetical protein
MTTTRIAVIVRPTLDLRFEAFAPAMQAEPAYAASGKSAFYAFYPRLRDEVMDLRARNIPLPVDPPIPEQPGDEVIWISI